LCLLFSGYLLVFFFFNDTATTDIYTLSYTLFLHDALPIYEAGSRTPLPDPEVERTILDASSRAGIARRAIAQEEIVERMIYPMINEGARILEEGIATRPSDIDVIWVYGYGWPVWRGGPMYYADRLGLAHIRDRLTLYAERSGDETLRPATRIARLGAEGRGFAS
jgi:3-hydroxyacyl-CoA dehydrogenase